MNIRYSVQNADKVAEWVKSLPRGIKAAVMRAISEYVIGDSPDPPGAGRHGLRYDIKYKYISRKQAYPPSGWQSDKQRRYVMAALKSGEIKIGRKNTPTDYSQSWRWEQENSQWDRTKITGKLPFDRFPSRHNMLAGWRHWSKVVETNMTGAIRSAQKAVDEFLKKGK